MSGKRVACLVLLQSVHMEMGSFRKDFSEEKNLLCFLCISFPFFPAGLPPHPPPPTSFLRFVLLLPLFLVHGLVYLPLSLLFISLFILPLSLLMFAFLPSNYAQL